MADRPWGPPGVRSRPSPSASWVPTLAVAGALAFVVFAGYAFAGDQGPGTQLGGEVQTGETVDVLQGVTLTTAAGWGIRERTSEPPGTLLEGNGGVMFVTATSGIVDPPETFVDAYLAGEAAAADPLTYSVGTIESFSLPAGPGAQASYVGTFNGNALEGAAYAIITPSGLGIILDGYAAEGGYFPAVADQVATMVGSVQAA